MERIFIGSLSALTCVSYAGIYSGIVERIQIKECMNNRCDTKNDDLQKNVEIGIYLNNHQLLTINTFDENLNNDTLIRLDNFDTRNIIYDGLVLRISNLLANPDDNEDRFLKMIKKELKTNRDFNDFFSYLFSRLSSADKKSVLSILLSSEINVFEKWYKDALFAAQSSNDKLLKKKAYNIYELYKQRFDSI